MNLGNTIKDIRKHKGYTQGDFAMECGITQTYLSQIENNQKEPNLSVLKKISEKLVVPLPILFFLSITEEDVQQEKREMFNTISPTVKNIINEIFTV
ncbi:MAG: transcriptional regulator [Flavobacterium psychrophilum]|nr:MAG: transcriptional regulator [Flavobacterium psychrophilum]